MTELIKPCESILDSTRIISRANENSLFSGIDSPEEIPIYDFRKKPILKIILIKSNINTIAVDLEIKNGLTRWMNYKIQSGV